MKIIAVIPVKSNSTRVPNKNFRDFSEGMSLLDIKLKQCLDSKFFSDVYVSTDVLEIKEKVEELGAKFLLRGDTLCSSETPWHDVLCGIIKSIPVDDDTYIAWTPVTSPLFSRYDEAISSFINSDCNDSLMAVTKLNYFMLNERFQPINFSYGVWASHTQSLSPFYQMNCALWIARKLDMLNNNFQLGVSPLHFECSHLEGIDIDYPDEFKLAQLMYENKKELLMPLGKE